MSGFSFQAKVPEAESACVRGGLSSVGRASFCASEGIFGDVSSCGSEDAAVRGTVAVGPDLPQVRSGCSPGADSGRRNFLK